MEPQDASNAQSTEQQQKEEATVKSVTMQEDSLGALLMTAFIQGYKTRTVRPLQANDLAFMAAAFAKVTIERKVWEEVKEAEEAATASLVLDPNSSRR